MNYVTESRSRDTHLVFHLNKVAFLWGGLIHRRLSLSERLNVGEELPFIWAVLNQIQSEPFISTFCLKCIYLFTKMYILLVHNVPGFFEACLSFDSYWIWYRILAPQAFLVEFLKRFHENILHFGGVERKNMEMQNSIKKTGRLL